MITVRKEVEIFLEEFEPEGEAIYVFDELDELPSFVYTDLENAINDKKGDITEDELNLLFSDRDNMARELLEYDSFEEMKDDYLSMLSMYH